VIILPGARALNSRSIDETVVPTEYFKTSLANLLFLLQKRQFGIAASGFHGTVRGMTEVHDRGQRVVHLSEVRETYGPICADRTEFHRSRKLVTTTRADALGICAHRAYSSFGRNPSRKQHHERELFPDSERKASSSVVETTSLANGGLRLRRLNIFCGHL
jgi:hypothetical protein